MKSWWYNLVVLLKARGGKKDAEIQKCCLALVLPTYFYPITSFTKATVFSVIFAKTMHCSSSIMSWVALKSPCRVFKSTSFWLIMSLPFGPTDPAGSEVQPFCGLVVLWRPSLWDANRSVTFPWARWRGTLPLHPHGQPLLPTMAREGG